jgi:hypothetical protein
MLNLLHIATFHVLAVITLNFVLQIDSETHALYTLTEKK